MSPQGFPAGVVARIGKAPWTADLEAWLTDSFRYRAPVIGK